MKAYVVIDVEMCKVQKGYVHKDYRHSSEIIQIGAVMLSESYEKIAEFTTYVNPQYGKIDYYIENLTGISAGDVKHAPSLEEALRSMLLWIGTREVTFYSWSTTDYLQIRGEILSKKIDQDEMALFLDKENWIDYQKTIGERFKINRSLSLRDALDLSELTQEGRMHDGLTDAINTARMIAKLELNPDYRFALDKLRDKEKEEYIPLSVSLGSLLKNIQLDVA